MTKPWLDQALMDRHTGVAQVTLNREATNSYNSFQKQKTLISNSYFIKQIEFKLRVHWTYSPLQSLTVPYSPLQFLTVPYSPLQFLTVPYSPL